VNENWGIDQENIKNSTKTAE